MNPEAPGLHRNFIFHGTLHVPINRDTAKYEKDLTPAPFSVNGEGPGERLFSGEFGTKVKYAIGVHTGNRPAS